MNSACVVGSDATLLRGHSGSAHDSTRSFDDVTLPPARHVRETAGVYQGIKDHINLDLVKCVLMAGPGFVKETSASVIMHHVVKSP